MKKRRYDDDEILKDGEKLHVSMFAMDGMDPLQQAIANDGLRVTDGAGGTQGLNRPGFRLAAADVDRRTTAADLSMPPTQIITKTL